jgi:uncharacterized protein YciI
MSKTSLYLYKIQAVRPAMITEGATEDEARIVAAHFDYLKGLTEAGVVLLAGRTLNEDNSTFGIIIFRANSELAARQIVEADPAVKNRIMRAELYPYRIALLGDLAIDTHTE